MHGKSALIVPDGAALVLNLDGQIVDQASERPLLAAFSGQAGVKQIQVRDVLKAINSARTDDRIKALVLELDVFTGSGQANLQAMGRALKAFGATGKPIYAYATAYTDDSYYLAAHASHIWVNPLGGVLLTGPGGTNLYFKKALDRLEVDINVFKVGTYKSAVEPFTRGDASPEAEAAAQALVDTLWGEYRANVHALRPKVDLQAVLANLPERLKVAGGNLADTAKATGLVDEIGSQNAFRRALQAAYGKGERDRFGSFNSISMTRYLAARGPDIGSGDAIGVVYVSGDIVDGDAPPGTAGGDTIARLIDDALSDDDIKALVVRIDSGGGSVLASERIREALAGAHERGLPIVASFGPVAASGGYWVATAADEIYAESATITGSIGVFAIIPSFPRVLDEWGIGADGVKSTPYSGSPDVLRGLSPQTSQLLQASVEDIYRRFTGLVAQARKLPVARVDAIGQGRVWAGSTARQLGLIDQFGGLDAAVKAAARRAKLPENTRTIDVEQKPSWAYQFFAGAMSDEEDEAAANAAVRDPFARLARIDQRRIVGAFAQARSIANGPTMQAACLECTGLLPPQLRAADGFWTPLLAKIGL
jgi:protease-4